MFCRACISRSRKVQHEGIRRKGWHFTKNIKPFIELNKAFDSTPQVHTLVEKAEVVRPDWNGYNVLHDTASRVAALDIGFLPSAAARAAPPAKLVYLLGSDDFTDADVPADAFVIYQVGSNPYPASGFRPGS